MASIIISDNSLEKEVLKSDNLTLVDNKNEELDMGTEFDDFSRLSYHGCKEISAQSYKNRLILNLFLLLLI